MFSAAEREAVRVTGDPKTGKLVWAETGKPVTATENSIYVMDTHGNMYVYESSATIKHSSALADGDAIAGGGIRAYNGNLWQLTEQSGHLQPPVGRADLVKTELGLQGVDVDGVIAK